LKTIEEILRLAAPLEPSASIRIHNPPWKDLIIEDLHRRGPGGWSIYAIAECDEHEERFPLMLFEILSGRDLFKMTPLSLCRDISSKVEECATENHGCWMILNHLQESHSKFAKSWDKKLRKRGYVEAFQDMQRRGATE